jgi:two-component system chemotaxis response regulator CheY
MNILLADDDLTCRTLLGCIIASLPEHTYVQAEDGEKAWQLLADPSRHFDLGIFDVMMPGLDGIGLIERIRATPRLRTMHVVLCTVLKDRHTVERAHHLSVIHYIVKPYTKAIILGKIYQVAADLIAANTNEDAVTAAGRLGLEPAEIVELTGKLAAEIRQWLVHARSQRGAADFRRLAIGANGLKGAAPNLGWRALSLDLERVEAVFLQAAAAGPHFPAAPGEVDRLLSAVDIQLSLVAAHLGAAA